MTDGNMIDGRRRGTSKQIFETIRDNPGITKRDLSVITDVNFYTLQYHLINLKEDRKINYVRLGKRYHWFTGERSVANTVILKDRHKEIYKVIKENKNISSTEIASEAEISLPMVSYYTSLLLSQEVILCHRDGKRKCFKISNKEPILYSQIY